MEIISVIFDVVLVVFVFVAGLFIKNYIPKYLEQKAENLATKEDVAEITRITEEVQKDFKEHLEIFSTDVKFKYDYFYKQYSELYCKLYSIIVQSEYLRSFAEKTTGRKITFEEAPFLEVCFQKLQVDPSVKNDFEPRPEVCGTIEAYNKVQLCDLIIEKQALASQSLLKLAVAYRFANFYYGHGYQDQVEEVANDEEFRMINEIVCTIVRDYNYLRRELRMSFDERELTDGILLL